jgi:hypothetical protein
MVNRERDECILHFATFYNRKFICVMIAIASQSSNSSEVKPPLDDQVVDSCIFFTFPS